MKEKIKKKFPVGLLIGIILSILLLAVIVYAAKVPKFSTSGIPLIVDILGLEGSGREDTILVEAFSHEISVPFDPGSGLPTGSRVHNALVVTKSFDKATPGFHKALTSGKSLDEVTIKFFRTEDKDEDKEHYFTIKLEDAIVVGIKSYMPNILDSNNENFGHMEDVTFTYRKIKWTWEPDGIEAEDEWVPPR